MSLTLLPPSPPQRTNVRVDRICWGAASLVLVLALFMPQLRAISPLLDLPSRSPRHGTTIPVHLIPMLLIISAGCWTLLLSAGRSVAWPWRLVTASAYLSVSARWTVALWSADSSLLALILTVAAILIVAVLALRPRLLRRSEDLVLRILFGAIMVSHGFFLHSLWTAYVAERDEILLEIIAETVTIYGFVAVFPLLFLGIGSAQLFQKAATSAAHLKFSSERRVWAATTFISCFAAVCATFYLVAFNDPVAGRYASFGLWGAIALMFLHRLFGAGRQKTRSRLEREDPRRLARVATALQAVSFSWAVLLVGLILVVYLLQALAYVSPDPAEGHTSLGAIFSAIQLFVAQWRVSWIIVPSLGMLVGCAFFAVRGQAALSSFLGLASLSPGLPAP